MSTLVVSGVSTFYGRIRALDDVSLEVGEGEIVALIGANGAGKTTLLKTISGMMRPRTGEVTFDGQPITRITAEKIVARGISHVPENRQLFSTMTVDENLVLGAYRRYRKVGKATVAADAEKLFGIFPILSERRNQLAGTLSGGQQQMLAIARGLMADPKLVLLDEPSLGLAPLVVKELFEVIRGLRDGGVTVLLVEQNAHAALKLAGRGYLLEVGKVVLEGAATDLLEDDRVHAAYLGGAAGE
ncbi:high-affinity branched-chain amino acid transport ATP-binding protein LivF [bacterium BMS3Abin02]|nr:high-affinity branched-chain amino acid transport ATP-binding protein LivF [bacterium BMS3Abin02]GBE22746.1 high-affinity branched-chain amino acid transport ATP-binding protein LivF [bacterium BMS3Bbin01]HDK45182.1 ABC transporter ATP-binding protein [Actinomycetota bacterium]